LLKKENNQVRRKKHRRCLAQRETIGLKWKRSIGQVDKDLIGIRNKTKQLFI
jgi:hypothetical protein